MSKTLDDSQIRQLRAVMGAIAEIARTKKSLESLRDSLVNEFRAAGVSAQNIATTSGLARSRVYQILEEPNVAEDDPDAGEIAFEFQKRFDAALEWGFFEWEQAGRVGEPDDFFPLDQLVRSVS